MQRSSYATGLLAAGLMAVSAASAMAQDTSAMATACAELSGQTVPASAIGIRSGAATVRSAELVPAAAAASSGQAFTPATPAFCKVLGAVAPVDPQAQPILFEVNLPERWNGKAVQYGGGGYNGTLVTGLTPLRDAAPSDPLPLARGYITLGTDSGHQAGTVPPDQIGRFGTNEEMLTNYGFAAYKKVHDVAVVLARTVYNRAPERFYYFGGSEGGREGLTMAQRFPDDYDGVVSVVPVVRLSMLFQSYLPNTAPQFEGGWMDPAQVATLARFVLKACDARDGLADGVVSDPLGCASHVDLNALRCPDGAQAGADCLSDRQVATVRAVHAPHPFPFAMANGIVSYPGHLYGNETTPDPVNPTMTRWVTGTAPPALAIDPDKAAQQWLYGANFVRFFVTGDAGFDPRGFKAEDYAARVRHVSEIIDSTNPDLGRFFARGGKLIMRENLSDLAQSPMAGIEYFAAVQQRLGGDAVGRSARLYLSPGSNHTGTAASVTTGKAVPTNVDLLDPLDQWVTAGTPPPDALVQTLQSPVPPFAVQARRPMCQYPLHPHFNGGDPGDAASYRCAPSEP